MADGIKGRRAIGEDHLSHEGPQILVIVREALEMAAIAVAGEPGRSTLPAHIENGHAITAPHEIAGGFEIALDEIAASAEDDDGALWPRDLDAHGSERQAVPGFD